MGLLSKFSKLPNKDLKEDVADAIMNLLKTKQTFGAWQKGFGMDDYSYANRGEEILQNMMEDICLNIKNQEKRFKLDVIRLGGASRPTSLCFELEGTLAGVPQTFFIYFDKARSPRISTSQFS